MQVGAAVTAAPLGGPVSVDAQGLGFSTSPGQVAQLANRFQVGDCARLPFKPRLRIRLTGRKQTRDGGHPGLRARLTQRPGQAAIRQVKVALPRSLALDPDNAQALCEYEDGLRLQCPASSIIGQAEAVSPLLNEPLRGPVYFVKNVRISRRTGRRIRTLPTLLVTLTGENGVKINLRPTSDVDKKARLVSTFSNLPDAPVSSFKLRLEGGKDGILVVSRRNVCKANQIADQQFDAHNGKTADKRVSIQTPCPLKVHAKKRGRRNVKLKIGGLRRGRLTVSGRGIKTTRKRIRAATVASVRAPLTRPGRRMRRLRIRVRFDPAGPSKPKTIRTGLRRIRP
jgi:hypothetical protein